jgi:ADP-ribose pyrophosphatase
VERIDSKTVYEGKLADVRIDKFRFQDGDEIERKVVEHPGSVAIVAYDDDHVHLIRQPREPVGDPALLEIPAGKMDVEGETRLECAKRELAEEIGLEASEWEEVRRFYTSPGLLTELVSVFFATEIKPTGEIPESADPDEHLELVLWPLGKLDEAIEACEDAKTLIGLLELQKRLA